MTRESARAAAWRWPLLLVGLFLVTGAANAILVCEASSDPSFAVEEDYYQKALAWNERMEQERRNRRLGWRLELQLAPATRGRTRLLARLADEEGRPLRGARVDLEAFHKARSRRVLRARLSEGSSASYAATLPLRRRGLWELRFVVERGRARFTRRLEREIAIDRAPSGQRLGAEVPATRME